MSEGRCFLSTRIGRVPCWSLNATSGMIQMRCVTNLLNILWALENTFCSFCVEHSISINCLRLVYGVQVYCTFIQQSTCSVIERGTKISDDIIDFSLSVVILVFASQFFKAMLLKVEQLESLSFGLLLTLMKWSSLSWKSILEYTVTLI